MLLSLSSRTILLVAMFLDKMTRLANTTQCGLFKIWVTWTNGWLKSTYVGKLLNKMENSVQDLVPEWWREDKTLDRRWNPVEKHILGAAWRHTTRYFLTFTIYSGKSVKSGWTAIWHSSCVYMKSCWNFPNMERMKPHLFRIQTSFFAFKIIIRFFLNDQMVTYNTCDFT